MIFNKNSQSLISVQVLFHVSHILKLYVNFSKFWIVLCFNLYVIACINSTELANKFTTEDDCSTIETCLVLNLKLLNNHWLVLSSDRRYEIVHLNFGFGCRHFLCPATKLLSIFTLPLTSSMTNPSENISEAKDGGWPRTISGAICRCLFLYSSCSCAVIDFRLEWASDSRIAFPKRQVQNAGHRSQGTGHRAQGTGHRLQGTGHRS